MRHLPLLLAALAFPLLPACDKREGVSVRDEPREAPALPAPAAGQAPAMPKTQVGAGQTLWAGGVKANDGRWLIFKTIGASDAVAKHRAALEALAKNETDELPLGWSQDKASSQFGRIATLRTPAPELEVSISLVGGDLAGNVNRWRGQAGLPELPAAEAEAQAKKLDEKTGAWAFEVEGKDEAPQASAAPGTQTPALSFTLPAGWTQVKPSSDMRLAQFDAGGCEVAITRFPGQIGGQMGSTLDNLNRWRGQIGLAPWKELPSVPQAVPMSIGGHPAAMVQVAAVEGESADEGKPTDKGEPAAQKAMLVAFVADEKGTFFIKLIGPVDMAEAQLMPMVDFLKTLKLPFEGKPAPLPADLRLLPKIGK